MLPSRNVKLNITVVPLTQTKRKHTSDLNRCWGEMIKINYHMNDKQRSIKMDIEYMYSAKMTSMYRKNLNMSVCAMRCGTLSYRSREFALGVNMQCSILMQEYITVL